MAKKQINFSMDAEMHTKIKIAAAESGISMSEWMLKAFMHALGEKKK